VSFDAFIAAGWAAHGERPEAVAADLAASLGRVDAPAHVAPFARLAVHVFGEHLGDWAGGVALLESLRAGPAFDGSPAVTGAIDRGVATLRFASGDRAALAALGADDRVAALAGAASALAGHRAWDAASRALEEAIAALPEDAVPTSLAARALAIGGNNLAAALYDAPARGAAECDTMVAAARTGLEYWRRAGTWLEEERAHWRLATCLLAAGRAAEAVGSARDCLDVCERNAAPPFELFFAFAALAFALQATGDAAAAAAARERAGTAHAGLEEDDRPACAGTLARLEGLAPGVS
jgi:hypothetical protein